MIRNASVSIQTAARITMRHTCAIHSSPQLKITIYYDANSPRKKTSICDLSQTKQRTVPNWTSSPLLHLLQRAKADLSTKARKKCALKAEHELWQQIPFDPPLHQLLHLFPLHFKHQHLAAQHLSSSLRSSGTSPHHHSLSGGGGGRRRWSGYSGAAVSEGSAHGWRTSENSALDDQWSYQCLRQIRSQSAGPSQAQDQC